MFLLHTFRLDYINTKSQKKEKRKRKMNWSLCGTDACVCRVAVLGKGEVKGGVVYELGRYGLRVTVRFP